jgi:uncharacterized protein YciI
MLAPAVPGCKGRVANQRPALRMKPMAPSRPRAQNIPRNLKPYFLAFFRAGERWNQTDGVEDLPARQLAFLRTQFESGIYRAAGPITDGSAISAVAIIEAESLEAAKNLAEQDPAVVAERLVVEVHPALLPALDAVRVEY